MSVFIFTSSEQAQEHDGGEYLPCCGITPTVLTWKQKPFVALVCANLSCANHQGVLGYSARDVRERWEQFRMHSDSEAHS